MEARRIARLQVSAYVAPSTSRGFATIAMRITRKNFLRFRNKIWRYWRMHRRDLPWRRTKNPYRILVSEVMLQQTQVARVFDYYPRFVRKFPDFAALARARVVDVLRAWQGLGYNRRALALHALTGEVKEKYGGRLPRDSEVLVTLPGIGKATAGAIAAFAFGIPSVFIETNIRRVFIHSFFARRRNVSDDDILPLVKKTLDTRNPREWYYALMDYGAMLAKQVPNPNRDSTRYRRPPPFKGSRRELRGKILKLLLQEGYVKDIDRLAWHLSVPRDRVQAAAESLRQEGFLTS